MKRLILPAVLVAGFSFTSNAQLVHYGISLGANLTHIQGNGIERTYNPGFFGGAFARVPLDKKWDIEPEILYNYCNSKKANNFINYYNVNGYPQAQQQIRLSYLSVPLLVGYKVNKLLKLNAGPQYSFLVYDDEDLIISNKADAFKRNDFGIVAGGEVNLSIVRFFADYTYGLFNINDIDNRYKWFNSQVLVGMSFDIF
jgi:hypothetical protein